MQAIFMHSDGSFEEGIPVSVYPKTGKYQVTIPGRFLPLRGDVNVQETPTGMKLVENFSIEFQNGRAKVVPNDGSEWSKTRMLITGRVYGPKGSHLNLEVGEKSHVLAISYGWNQRGDQRQFVDFILLLREGDEAWVEARPRKNKEADPEVVATIFVGDDGKPVRIQGERPESEMEKAMKEVRASFA